MTLKRMSEQEKVTSPKLKLLWTEYVLMLFCQTMFEFLLCYSIIRGEYKGELVKSKLRVSCVLRPVT